MGGLRGECFIAHREVVVEQLSQAFGERSVTSRIKSHRRQFLEQNRLISDAEIAWNGSLQQKFQFQMPTVVAHGFNSQKGAGFPRLWEDCLTYQHV